MPHAGLSTKNNFHPSLERHVTSQRCHAETRKHCNVGTQQQQLSDIHSYTIERFCVITVFHDGVIHAAKSIATSSPQNHKQRNHDIHSLNTDHGPHIIEYVQATSPQRRHNVATTSPQRRHNVATNERNVATNERRNVATSQRRNDNVRTPNTNKRAFAAFSQPARTSSASAEPRLPKHVLYTYIQPIH